MARTAVAKPAGKSNLPASMSAEILAEIEDLKKKIAAPSGDRIQITQDKQFRMPGGATLDTLECVVVDFLSVNTLYDGVYRKGESSPPLCFAIGINPTELAPSPNSPEPQAEKCASCAMNQFGSAGKGKACKNGKLLAVLPPDADANTPIMVLRTPPTSINPFDTYVRSVAKAFGRPPKGVITEISMNADKDYPELVFTAVAPTDDGQFMLAHSRRGEAMERLTVEPDVTADASAASKSKLKAPVRRRQAA